MAGKQNPKIALSESFKQKLDSLKKYPSQTYEEVITSRISSQAAASIPTSQIVGASAGDEAVYSYGRYLAWVQDTQKKLPNGSVWKVTPSMREEAYDTDALTRGIIVPFLKNILLGGSDIVTSDNKKYSEMVEDIRQFLIDIDLLAAFKEDFEDYAIKHGHSYRRKDYSPENNDVLEKLQRLEPKGLSTYEDPWDSSIKAYHQRVYINEAWSTSATTKLVDSWFIPEGLKYIENDEISETGAKELWEQYQTKYKITEHSNLRVGAAEDIIAMHKVRVGTPAPIDPVILEIWLKRLILANGPNFIFRVLSPFLHIKNGVLLQVAGQDGSPMLLSSVPDKPPEGMASTDPEKYAALSAAHTDWVTACQTDADNVVKYLAEGGVFASGPDKTMNVIESGRSISPAFIETMLRIMDNNIGMAFGFPVSLILARGAELATSQTIKDIFNTVYSGSQTDYEKIANTLIAERFEGETWDYRTTKKDGTEESGTYTFEETAAQFKLSTGDVKDALKTAQTSLVAMQTLQTAKAIGAGKSDIQALGDEYGFGLLDLDKFDQAAAPAQGAGMFGLDRAGNGEEDIVSAEKKQTDTAPADLLKPDEKLKNELLDAYQEAKKAMDVMLESSGVSEKTIGRIYSVSECIVTNMHDAPQNISSGLGNDPKMKDAISFSAGTGKEVGYAINRTADGKLELGESKEGINGAVINGKSGNAGFFHTHPDENIMDGPSRNDFSRLLQGKDEIIAVQNININDNGWIAMRTKETPKLSGRKAVEWTTKGNGIKGADKADFTSKYMKPMLKDLEKNNIQLYYGKLNGEMKQIRTWDDYTKGVLK